MKKKARLHDPKIVPPPGERVDIETGLSKEDLDKTLKDAGCQSVDDLMKDAGCWSVGEFFRTISNEYVHERRERANDRPTTLHCKIIKFPKD